MRGMMQVWMHVLGGRCKRVVVVLFLISLLLAAQIITHHARPVSEFLEVAGTPHISIQQQVGGGEAAGHSTPPGEAKPATPKYHDSRFDQQEAAKKKILESLSHMEVKELQTAMRFLNSAHDPKAVQQFRIDHGLQALKVSLLEEVSAKKYPDIMEAAHNGRALSEQARPGPVQVVIATSWRSGSTFLEELLSSHPAVYTFYEPLMQFGVHQVRSGEDSVRAVKIIHDLLHCRYQGHDDYMQTAHKFKEMIYRNTLVWSICNSKEWGDSLCYNDVFLSKACNLFPWSSMKLVRLRLKFLRSVLEDEKLNIRLVFLVRDPRGVINSRTNTVDWCKTSDCSDPQFLCSDMDEDLTAALEFHKAFPRKLFILRYEDMSLNPINKTRELLDFLGLDFDAKMEEFLVSHTTKNYDQPWSTTRESKKRVTHWVSKLPAEKLQEVQSACDPIMRRLGYKSITSTKDIKLDEILEPLALPIP